MFVGMKRVFSILGTCLLMSVLLFSSCGKYDEGPALSFITKKERISNIWRINYVEDNDPTGAGYPYSLDRFQEAGIVITLEKNGRAKITLDGEDGEPLVVTGRWDFRDSNRRIEWRWDAEVPGFSPAFNLTPIYRIRQLREDQLHLTSDDERFRFHLEPFR
jgi:hypothetical protein